MLENDKQKHRKKIIYQIKEQYGKVTYSYTCHLKEARIIRKKIDLFKGIQIFLSSVTTAGIFTDLLGKIFWASVLSGGVSVALLFINTYLKGIDFESMMNSHIQTSNDLWIVREKYISLLVDSDILSSENLISRRDELTSITAEIYSKELKTSKKAYEQTQVALKNEEEQFFSLEELNSMLPQILRERDDAS